MHKSKVFISFFFITVCLLVSLRFLFFTAYINLQKSDFRAELIIQNTEKVSELSIPAEDLYLDKKGFEWKEQNTEVVINGVYHEVIAIKKIKDKVLLFVIEDEAENNLFEKYFCLNKKTQKTSSELLKVFLNLHYLENKPGLTFHSPDICTGKIFTDWRFTGRDPYLELIKPPEFLT